MRSEVERAFFFNVTHQLLKERFGELGITSSLEEKKLLERLGSEAQMSDKTNSDIQAVIESRREFNQHPNRDKILAERRDTTQVMKSGKQESMDLQELLSERRPQSNERQCLSQSFTISKENPLARFL